MCVVLRLAKGSDVPRFPEESGSWRQRGAKSAKFSQVQPRIGAWAGASLVTYYVVVCIGDIMPRGDSKPWMDMRSKSGDWLVAEMAASMARNNEMQNQEPS